MTVEAEITNTALIAEIENVSGPPVEFKLPVPIAVEIANGPVIVAPAPTVDPDPANRIIANDEGLYVPPVAEGDFPDLTLIFENSLV